ncbi:hypothetical protein R9C00_20110 [Flammeovirgaceae bacterium SG7u.111]|nr:hypothetical protein [Flammeovirgaceae bacterium SG7u.132]WPO34006.1 hypothetical protein R9C00_20110 [Flammeovirgaceae bacterium SG7u.111]
MELDEMKALWENMGKEMEKQKVLTHKLIVDMTKEKYQNRLQKIIRIEGAGTIICIIYAGVILFNFGKLEAWYLEALGIFSILVFLLLPYFSLKTIVNLKKLDIGIATYKQLLSQFAIRRKRFFYVQKMGVVLGFLLGVAILPVVSKITSNKDFLAESQYWMFLYIPFLVISLFFFSRWTLGKYARIADSAENLLKDLEE